jgi:hypothetical protein
MTRTILIVLALALAAGSLWWVLRDEHPEGVVPEDADARAEPEATPGPMLRGAAPERADPAAQAGATRAAPASADELVLVGRVVDTSRRGVAGATVVWMRHEKPEVRVTTDATGAYRIGTGEAFRPTTASHEWWRQTFAVRAYDAAGLVDQRQAHPRAGAREVEVPWHVLKRGGTLRVRVAGPGGPLAGAEVRITNLAGFQPSLSAVGRADAQGHFDPGPLPPSRYRVVAVAPSLGRGATVVALAAGEAQVAEVTLAAARTLEVRVLSGKGDLGSGATDAPLAGARVEVLERVDSAGSQWALPCDGIAAPAPTDAEGRTRVEGLGPELISLVVGADGHEAATLGAHVPGQQRAKSVSLDGEPPTSGQTRVGLAPTAKEVTFVLRPLVRLRWPIQAGDVPAPRDGTVLQVQADPSGIDAVVPATARVEGGFIVGEGWSDAIVHAFAVAPDGTYARLFRIPDQGDGKETTFQRPRRLTARVKTSDGKPAAGYFASVRNQGNVTVAEPTALDRDGSASWTLFHPYLVEVYVAPTNDHFTGWTVGSADLKAGDGVVEGVMPLLREITLHVTVDGRPGLPPEPVLKGPLGGHLGALKPISEDPDTGVIRVLGVTSEVPAPGERLLLFVAAQGFLETQAQIVSAGAGGDGSIVARVDLARSGSLKIRVLPAPGAAAERLDVQRLHPAPRGWQPSGVQGSFSRPLGADVAAGATESVVLVPDQPPGLHRVVAPGCLGVSPVVEVRAGEEVEVVLDLRASGLVKGRVEAPEGFALEATEISLDPGDIPLERFSTRTVRVGRDGTFELRVPGDRALPLRVRHPRLRLDPALGTLQVERPRDGLVVRLVTAPGLSWTVTGGPPLAPPRPEASPPPPGLPDPGSRVLLFDDAEGHDLATATIRHEGRAQREGEGFVLGGLSPGRYTLWMDLVGCAPIVKRGVVVGEGVTDLGALEAEAGTTLRVRFRVKQGSTVPRVSLWAQREAAPSYLRTVTSRGGADDLLLPGLGPGRFRIQVAPMMGGGPYTLERTLDVTGTGEIVLDVGPP